MEEKSEGLEEAEAPMDPFMQRLRSLGVVDFKVHVMAGCVDVKVRVWPGIWDHEGPETHPRVRVLPNHYDDSHYVVTKSGRTLEAAFDKVERFIRSGEAEPRHHGLLRRIDDPW